VEVPEGGKRIRVGKRPADLRPEEYRCHLRGRLRRGFSQAELDRTDVWYIDEAGHYLDAVLSDVRQAFGRAAWPWFERLGDRREVLRILETEPESDDLWGFGNNPSPRRAFILGYVAKSLGRNDVAVRALTAARQSRLFTQDDEQLRKDIKACGG